MDTHSIATRLPRPSMFRDLNIRRGVKRNRIEQKAAGVEAALAAIRKAQAGK